MALKLKGTQFFLKNSFQRTVNKRKKFDVGKQDLRPSVSQKRIFRRHLRNFWILKQPPKKTKKQEKKKKNFTQIYFEVVFRLKRVSLTFFPQ